MPQQLSDSVPNNPVILLLGPAGCGKTTFMTRFTNIYIIDIDKNLAGPRKVAKQETRDISTVSFDHIDTDDAGQPLAPLQHYGRFKKLIEAAIKNPLVKWIGITSTTTFCDVLKNDIRRRMNKPPEAEFKGFDMWGAFEQDWSQIIASLRVCGKPIIIDGHVRAEKDDMDQVLRYALAIPGATGNLLPMKVTDVWRMYVEQKLEGGRTVDKYMISTVQDNRNPNYKSSLDLPRTFEATQEIVKQIESQIK